MVSKWRPVAQTFSLVSRCVARLRSILWLPVASCGIDIHSGVLLCYMGPMSPADTRRQDASEPKEWRRDTHEPNQVH